MKEAILALLVSFGILGYAVYLAIQEQAVTAPAGEQGFWMVVDSLPTRVMRQIGPATEHSFVDIPEDSAVAIVYLIEERYYLLYRRKEATWYQVWRGYGRE